MKTLEKNEISWENHGVHLKFAHISVDNSPTGLRPIYVMFFKFLPIRFQMKNNGDMWL